MPLLYHHPLCPHSRFIRLALAEYGVEAKLAEECVQERRHAFLLLNPAGETPVLELDDGATLCGASAIAEYLDENLGAQPGALRLMPGEPQDRAETRRLMDWFLRKFHAEVSEPLVTEKVHKRFLPVALGGGGPDMNRVRAARTNARAHLRYIGWLAATRYWLAGEALSFADLAAAAHISCVD
jgi:glutathione S-transferase